MSHDFNAGGRLFHTDGPQTAKLQSPCVVLVRGTVLISTCTDIISLHCTQAARLKYDSKTSKTKIFHNSINSLY